MRTTNAPFKLAPKALNRVGINISLNVPSQLVLNSLVRVFLAYLAVGRILIRHNLRAWLNMLFDKRHHGDTSSVIADLGNQAATPLNYPYNSRFASHASSPVSVAYAAHVGFVHFNRVRKLGVYWLKKNTDLLRHAPGGLVGYSQVPFKLLSRYSVFGVGKQEDGVEPTFKRGIRLMKDCVCQWVKLVSAELAGIAFAVLNLVKLSSSVA